MYEDICCGPFHLSTTTSFPGACILSSSRHAWSNSSPIYANLVVFSKAISFFFRKCKSWLDKYMMYYWRRISEITQNIRNVLQENIHSLESFAWHLYFQVSRTRVLAFTRTMAKLILTFSPSMLRIKFVLPSIKIRKIATPNPQESYTHLYMHNFSRRLHFCWKLLAHKWVGLY